MTTEIPCACYCPGWSLLGCFRAIMGEKALFYLNLGRTKLSASLNGWRSLPSQNKLPPQYMIEARQHGTTDVSPSTTLYLRFSNAPLCTHQPMLELQKFCFESSSLRYGHPLLSHRKKQISSLVADLVHSPG